MTGSGIRRTSPGWMRDPFMRLAAFSALAALVEEASQSLITTTNLGYFAEETLQVAQVVGLP